MKNQNEKRKQIWGKDLKNNKEMRGTLTELGFSECERPRDSSRARPGEALLRSPGEGEDHYPRLLQVSFKAAWCLEPRIPSSQLRCGLDYQRLLWMSLHP